MASNSPWHHLYNTRRWKLRRKQQLESKPLCAFCMDMGKIIPASVADHVIAHKGDEDLFFEGALQSLCETHHNSSKQKAEKRGLLEIGCDENGIPLSDIHHWK